MKKQKIQLGILLAVLFVLIVGFIGLKSYNEAQLNQQLEETTEKK